MTDAADQALLRAAYDEAVDGVAEGGRPIGAVLVKDGQIIARGRNRFNQTGDMTSHAETDCLRNAGRRAGEPGLTLYTTMAPCVMCTGAIVYLNIPRVVVGDAITYAGHLGMLREHGIEVTVLDDPDCIALARRFAGR